MFLRTNRDCLPKQHQATGVSSADGTLTSCMHRLYHLHGFRASKGSFKVPRGKDGALLVVSDG